MAFRSRCGDGVIDDPRGRLGSSSVCQGSIASATYHFAVQKILSEDVVLQIKGKIEVLGDLWALISGRRAAPLEA